MKNEIAMAKEYQIKLKNLCQGVVTFIAKMDVILKKPSTHERGKEIARAINQLELFNDQIRYFTLGIDYRKDTKQKRTKGLKLGKD